MPKEGSIVIAKFVSSRESLAELIYLRNAHSFFSEIFRSRVLSENVTTILAWFLKYASRDLLRRR